jgi:hypothetical protein
MTMRRNGMDDLTVWFNAQLDADAAPIAMPAWHEGYCMEMLVEDGRCLSCGADEDPANVTYQEQSPRALREIDAKRQVVARYERAMGNCRAHPDDLASAGALLALHGVVKLLAAVYDARPGYLESWRP